MWSQVLFLALVLFSDLEARSKPKPSKGKGKWKPRPSPAPSTSPETPTIKKCHNFSAIDMHWDKLPTILNSGHTLVNSTGRQHSWVGNSDSSCCSTVAFEAWRARVGSLSPGVLTFDPPISEFYLLQSIITAATHIDGIHISPEATVILQDCLTHFSSNIYLIVFNEPTATVQVQVSDDGKEFDIMVAECTNQTGSSCPSTISTAPTATSSTLTTTISTTTSLTSSSTILSTTPNISKCSNFLAIDMHDLKLPKILSSGYTLVSCVSYMPYRVRISDPSSCSEIPQDSYSATASTRKSAVLTFEPAVTEFYLLYFPIHHVSRNSASGKDVLLASNISPPATVIPQDCKSDRDGQYNLVVFDAPTTTVQLQHIGWDGEMYEIMVADCTDKFPGSSSTVSTITASPETTNATDISSSSSSTTTFSTTTTLSSSSSTTISTTTTLSTTPTPTKPGHCEDGKPDPVDTKMNWTTGCYDIDGNSYTKGDFLESCCGCFKFSCAVIQFNTTLIPPNYYWEKVLEDSCCSDCDGTVYPAGSVMQSRDWDDPCKTTITTQCIYISKQLKGVVQETSRFQQCCSNSSGVYPTGTSMLLPETCSTQECLRLDGRQEASWITSQKLSGCDCCVYNGSLVQNAGWVILSSGKNATCCEGRLLTDIENSSLAKASTPMATTY